jgi:hypothetical protein
VNGLSCQADNGELAAPGGSPGCKLGPSRLTTGLAGRSDAVVVEHGRVAPWAAGQPAEVAGRLDGRSSQHRASRSERRAQGTKRGIRLPPGTELTAASGPGPRLESPGNA